MIIQAIRAENFMKFSKLNLAEIPAQGIIGIEGPNESGKTTMGEAVLFALFGKTRTSLETSVSRLIRWGADYLSVEVEFHVPGRGDFLIYREIDKYGTNFVKVIDRATRSEVASGNVNVSEFLSRTLQFDFFEFHQSFYHNQSQQSVPREEQSGFVERMTGISQIHDSLQFFKKDIEQLEREFAHYQKDLQRNLQQMERYDRNAAKLPELRELARGRSEELERARAEHRRRQAEAEAMKRLGEERQSLARRLEQLAEDSAGAIAAGLDEVQAGLVPPSRSGAEKEFQEKFRDDLASEAKQLDEIRRMVRDFAAFCAAVKEQSERLQERLDPGNSQGLIKEEEQLRGRASGLRNRASRKRLFAALCLIAGLLSAGAAAAAFTLLRTAGFARWPVVGWSAAPLAILFLVLSVILWTRYRRGGREASALEGEAGRLEVEIRRDSEERERLAALLTISGPGEVLRAVKASEEITDRRLIEAREVFLRSHGPLVAVDSEREYRRALRSVAGAEREMRARAGREGQRIERTVQEADAAVKKARVDLDKVENEIHECESQAAKKEVLLGKNREIQGRSAEIRSAIELRRLSMELLEDTSSSIRNRIGPALSRFMKEALPRVTRGRYRDIKVGSDLSLQVFTGEKSDFLDPAELSGGTHEALALALRLATSQVFIAARTRQAQFMFLDEPFKMMDEARAVEALDMLRVLSSEIQQIFVIQPRFTPAQRAKFDWMVETAVEAAELMVPSPGSVPENHGGNGGNREAGLRDRPPPPENNRPPVVSRLDADQQRDGGSAEEVKGRALPLPKPHES